MGSRVQPFAPCTLSLALVRKPHPLAYVFRADVLIVVSLDSAPRLAVLQSDTTHDVLV